MNKQIVITVAATVAASTLFEFVVRPMFKQQRGLQ